MTKMFFFQKLVLLLSLACILIAEAKKCPPEDSILPCECFVPDRTSGDQLVNYFCGGLEHPQTLLNVLTASGDHPFPRLQLAGLTVSFIPASLLEKKSIQRLDIRQSNLVGLFDRVPQVNRKLQGITIENSNVLRGVEWELFKNIRNLTDIFLNEVPLKSLGKEFQDNVQPSLVNLELIRTNISKLSDEVFSKFINVKQITIIGGKISNLKRSMFPEVNVIAEFRFDENLIQSLPDDIFNDMPKLKSVTLTFNRMTTLPETLFGNFKEKNIEFLFHSNEINCNCQIRWITIKGWTPEGDCAAPEDMKGKKVHSVGADLDYCDDV